jgi:hypothetical protein
MPYVRKDTAGSTSLGHTWPEDGAVVEMPHDEAEELLAIPDGGFSLVDGSSEEPLADDDENPELAEVTPESEDAITEPDSTEDETTAKAPTRRGRKTSAEG